MRWLVGDIQGCAAQLERLVTEIGLDPATDELWSVGDLVNRGPDSAAALRLWRDVGGRGVVGNHDVHALLVASGARRPRRKDTFNDLLAAADRDELLTALRRLPLLARLRSPDDAVADVWVVHAGLHPAWTDLPAVAEASNRQPHDERWLTGDAVAFATRVRCCNAAGEIARYTGPPRDCPAGYRPWDEFYRGDTLIVHGHWAQRGYYRGRRTLGLDSGCVYGGELTAWCHEEDRIVQVPGVGR